MSSIDHIARAARRRRTTAGLVTRLGTLLVIGAGVGLVLLLVDRILGPSVFRSMVPSWIAVLAIPLVVSIAGALVLTLRKQPSLVSVATELDDRLDLKDRISSALEFQGQSDPFAALAVSQGQEIAESANVRDAEPIRFGASWITWPVVLAVAIAAGLFMPAFDLLTPKAGPGATVVTAEDRTAAASDVRAVADHLRAALDPESTEATPEQLEALDEIERQLAGGEIAPKEARARGASALLDAAQQKQIDAEAADRADAALRNRLAALEKTPEAPPSPLADAMRSGDLKSMQETIDSAMENPNTESTKMLADELSRLAEQIDQLAALDQAAADSALSQALDDAGLDPTTRDQINNATNPDEVRKALEQAGVDPQQADELAQRVSEQNQKRQAQEQAKQDMESLAESMRNAADEMRNPPPEQQPPEQEQKPDPIEQQGPGSQQSGEQQSGQEKPQDQQSGEQQQGEKQEGGQQQSRQEQSPEQQQTGQQGEQQSTEQQPGQQQPGEQQPSGSQPGESESQQQQPDQQGEQNGPTVNEPSDQGQPNAQEQGEQDQSPGTPKPDGQQPDNNSAPSELEGLRPDENEQEQQGPNQQSDQPTASGTSPNQRDDAPGDANGQQAQGTQQSSESGEQPSQGTPQQAPSTGRDGQGGTSGEGSASGGDKIEQLKRKLDQVEQRSKDAESSAQDAEQLRKQAQQLLDGMSDSERQELEELARQLAAQRQSNQGLAQQIGQEPLPSEFTTEPVDARRPGNADQPRVVGEWLPNRPGEPLPPDQRAAAESILREAAQGAERAVDDRAYPSRFSDLIRRHYRRLPERVLEPDTNSAQDPQ